MNHRARRTQGELIDFIEQRLGWDVTESRIDEDEGFRDEDPVLRLSIEAELKLDGDDGYRHDPDGGKRIPGE